jgi:putative ABC transport system ATP-binding protein
MSYKLQHVNLEYKDGNQIKYALKDLSLELPAKGLVIIYGPSGSGKTSLLYLLSGIKQATSGKVLFDNSDLQTISDDRKNLIGFVFQDSFLISYLNVMENVAIGRDDKTIVENTLKDLQILDLGQRFPFELSGGQKQRVAIARALVSNPKVLLADEPTASLDHTNAQKVIDILKNISTTKLVVLVTHDSSMLLKADKVIDLWDGGLLIKNLTE